MNFSGGPSRFEEKNVTTETISGVNIALNNQYYCTSSWDGDVRCYGIQKNGNSLSSSPLSRIGVNSPATSCCWNAESTNIFCGTLGGKVYLWDVASNSTQPQEIAQHNRPIVSVSLNKAANVLVTGSLDGDTRLYDVRSPTSCMNIQSNGSLTCLCNGYSYAASATVSTRRVWRCPTVARPSSTT